MHSFHLFSSGNCESRKTPTWHTHLEWENGLRSVNLRTKTTHSHFSSLTANKTCTLDILQSPWSYYLSHPPQKYANRMILGCWLTQIMVRSKQKPYSIHDLCLDFAGTSAFAYAIFSIFLQVREKTSCRGALFPLRWFFLFDLGFFLLLLKGEITGRMIFFFSL